MLTYLIAQLKQFRLFNNLNFIIIEFDNTLKGESVFGIFASSDNSDKQTDRRTERQTVDVFGNSGN